MTVTVNGPRNINRLQTAALVGLLLVSLSVIIGVAYVAHSLDQLRDAAYHRCLDTVSADMARDQARRVEVREFRRLGELATSSPTLTAPERMARAQSYDALADALQVAVDETVPPNCDLYRR